MGQEKRPFGVRISNELYDAIEKQAKREGRSPSNLGEVLLTWSFRQLEVAGNSLALLERQIGDSDDLVANTDRQSAQSNIITGRESARVLTDALEEAQANVSKRKGKASRSADHEKSAGGKHSRAS